MMIEAKDLQQRYGLTRSPAETSIGSLGVFKNKGNKGYVTNSEESKRNRLNSSILRTQFIILDDPLEGPELNDSTFTGIDLLFSNQYALVRLQDDVDLWRAYQGTAIVGEKSDPRVIYESITLDDFFKKRKCLCGKFEQRIYYGAPGTGKSHELDCRINSSNSLKADFDNFLNIGFSLDEDCINNCHSLCERFQQQEDKPLFDCTNPVDFIELREKFPAEPDASAWKGLLEKYAAFLEIRTHRTTFHPDYDYAQFVGAYKPTKEENDPIDYKFVPQVFANAYVAAWCYYLKSLEKKLPFIPIYLVIEEINRGNCAQIFGDIFQLLDRNEQGFSRYTIDADYDFAKYINNTFKKEILGDGKTLLSEYEKVVGTGKLRLPPNLNIYATMNTSDQSLFPMDSAFKRRFDWEYVPINCEHPEANFLIDVGDETTHLWKDFLYKVNENILYVTGSEDKQMGEFFIKPKSGNKIKFEEFRSKVLFYLWDSVYKDEIGNEDAIVFRPLDDKDKEEEITFQKLFEGGESKLVEQKKLVERIINRVVNWKKPN